MVGFLSTMVMPLTYVSVMYICISRSISIHYRKGFIVQISWLTTWSYTYNIRGLSLNPKIKLTLEAEQESKRLITHFSSNLKTFLHRKLLKCSLNLPFLWCKGQRAWEISSRCSPHLGVKVKAYAQFLGTTLTLNLSY